MEDAKRGVIFARLAKVIILAAREGGHDPKMNFKLRLAIEAEKKILDKKAKPAVGTYPALCQRVFFARILRESCANRISMIEYGCNSKTIISQYV